MTKLARRTFYDWGFFFVWPLTTRTNNSIFKCFIASLRVEMSELVESLWRPIKSSSAPFWCRKRGRKVETGYGTSEMDGESLTWVSDHSEVFQQLLTDFNHQLLIPLFPVGKIFAIGFSVFMKYAEINSI